MPPTADAFVRWLIRWRAALFFLAVVATIVSVRAASKLSFDRSIENMFAADDPLLAPYRRLKAVFGGDEIALAAYTDEQLLTATGLERLDRLSTRLAEVEGVRSVFSLTRGMGAARLLLTTPFGEPVIRLCEGYTIGHDRKTAGVVCLLEPEASAPVSRTATVDALRRAVEEHDASGVLTGEPVMIVDGFRYLEQDGRFLGRTATALLMLVIVVCFRSIRWVLVPLAVVYATLLWTEASLVSSGMRLSMVSSMLWAIVAVIGISTTVHLIVGYRTWRDAGHAPREALLLAGGLLAAPIFWSCATDAAGFGSLLVSGVGPVQDFGLMMAVASCLVLVAMAAVVPCLALAGRFDADPKRAWGEMHVERALARIVHWIDRRPRTTGAAIALIAGVCGAGIAWLDVETDFTKNFRATSPIVRGYDFVESRLGGAGVWDIIVPVPSDDHAAFLAQVRRMEDRLRNEVTVLDEQGQSTHGLTKVLSLVDVMDTILPFGSGKTDIGAIADMLANAAPVASLLYGRDPQNDQRRYLRIMLRAHERQRAEEKERLIEHVQRIAREEFEGAEATGFFVLLAHLIESLSRDQWRAFAVATAAIGAMMLLAFRDLRIALIALVPNALPVLVVTGLMGWLGIKINMGAAMIAAVSMGLSVDASVHYITSFRRLRASGLSTYEALDAAHQGVGRAMFFATAALVVGFLALAMSHFVPTIYFGVLVSLTMIGGLLGNLVVLPLLLRAVYGDGIKVPDVAAQPQADDGPSSR